MLRIDKEANGRDVILRISGRIDSAHLQMLKSELEGSPRITALDLDGVRLVDRDAVRFLGSCESRGVELRNCPLYVREWIFREIAYEPGQSSEDG